MNTTEPRRTRKKRISKRDIIAQNLPAVIPEQKPKKRKGQERKLQDPVEVEKRINAYLEGAKDQNKIPTITGLYNAIGISKAAGGRYQKQEHELLDVEGEDREGENEELNSYTQISELIKKGISHIEEQVENQLLNGNTARTTASIFWLKAHGWKDNDSKQEGNTINVHNGVILLPTPLDQRSTEEAQIKPKNTKDLLDL